MRKLVVIEGIDGCGKSSLISGLATLHSDIVATTCEPWDREMAEGYKSADPEDMAYAFAIDRKKHLERILPLFGTDDKIVLCDRYVYSNLAYQMYYGVPYAWILQIQPLNLMWPDYVIHLECDSEIAAKRSGETDVNRLEVIQNLYRTVYSLQKQSPVYVVNTSSMSATEVLVCVEGLLKSLEVL